MTVPVRQRRAGLRRRFALALAAAALLPAAEVAAQQKPGEQAQQYCSSIANAAADARFAWQKETLTALSKDIEVRIGQLEAKRAEYEEWLKRRQMFLAKADESVTAIYAKMKPEAASQQLTAMDSEAAAAILTRLDPRAASAIMNEMEPGRAARLANVITNTPKKAAPPRPEPAPSTPPESGSDAGSPQPQNSEKSG
ncbi:MotE family protein [Methylobacterium sp. WL18]|uniref:MotE family protein n=1 Tax=Methylobacterium sp. WL18 TaxID=2603897 RepID=UPI0011C8BEA8|nr:MotE family protein [Methylobacterium sp. WL18]TXN72211.1 MotE family protein [Methylobacterium sp. WL18]